MNFLGRIGHRPAIKVPTPAFLRWEWLLVWASLALFASIRAPIPAVNEPHFLSKARHFWDPEWCARDPFLQSSNAHYVFYATIGVPLQFIPFYWTAFIGRVVGWGLLAAGWCALSFRLSPVRGFSVLSVWTFLALATFGNWSGEWVVGGIEAKVLSYAFAWLSLASVLGGQTVRAGAWAGLSVCFHPVVGIWHTGAAFLAALGARKNTRDKSRLREFALAGLVWGLLAAPGILPAVSMLRTADPHDSETADYLQVFYRLNHHLDPYKFKPESQLFYCALIVLIAILHYSVRRNGPWKILFHYAMMAVGVALSGFFIRHLPNIAAWWSEQNLLVPLRDRLIPLFREERHIAKWLKFYPFRLADVVVPLVFSMQFASWIAVEFGTRFRKASVSGTGRAIEVIRRSVPWTVFAALLAWTMVGAFAAAKNDSRLKPEMFPGWLDVCRWVRSETPEDALCYVSSQGFGLKWYAERAEYASHKDCPQDALGIVDWNKRIGLITSWSKLHVEGVYTKRRIRELRALTDIDFVIVPLKNSKLASFPIAPVYQNQSYQVYRLTDAD